MKQSFTTFFLIISVWAASFAQSAIVPAGGTATGNGGTVTYTIGQIAVQTNGDGTASISEGVQQPYEISVVGVDNYPSISLSMSVYPNPTLDRLKLEISEMNFNGEVKVFDIGGKYLFSKKIEGAVTEMDFSSFAPGSYFVIVFRDKEQLKSFKVVKMSR